MANKKLNIGKVPNLRFPGFESEWETKKLGEIATFSKGKGISKSDIEENGITECIRYGELYTHYREIITEIKSKTNVNTSTLVLSEENDVVIPASGETTIDIATASCILKSGIALGGDLNIIKTENNGIFLSYYLNSKKKMEIANLAQGISVVHLYSSQLASLSLSLPKLNEQSKISSFLALLDERVQTQNKIIQQLETLIQALRNQIFKRKRRFTDTDGRDSSDWKKVKIGDILKIGSGKDYKHLQSGNIPVFGTGGFMTLVNDYLYDGETVCIGRKGTIDKPMYHKGKLWTVDTLFYTHSFQSCIPKFIFHLFQTINWLEYNEASGVPSLSKTTIEKIGLQIPSIEEQERIASFLSKVDQKIQIEKAILEQLEMQKKYMLQQMFV
ncbi:type I restriction enzyme S subunit [Chryseobacterium defluvii]|uniref:Type I restriction enzyme S subunit n=1 Tax=Chryseobacterium defluvii TaxID=160396 RepID=A0A840KCS6_9FLAO|nr:restriction endonuclease subunit S [Chryseobacterium defluvii]MBB4804792.1 type I restriction enzyme S subunit [Chryseobacterium defluvii]